MRRPFAVVGDHGISLPSPLAYLEAAFEESPSSYSADRLNGHKSTQPKPAPPPSMNLRVAELLPSRPGAQYTCSRLIGHSSPLLRSRRRLSAPNFPATGAVRMTSSLYSSWTALPQSRHSLHSPPDTETAIPVRDSQPPGSARSSVYKHTGRGPRPQPYSK